MLWPKFHIVAVLVFFAPVFLYSQPYGNEWIRKNQEYYKLLTSENGFYKVSGQELMTAGVPLASWNVSNIQLWHRGLEQAILITGAEDNRFDPSDTLIFWGKRNDGTLDSLLYKPSSAQPHRFFNLFSDTCAFFLTLGSTPGKRISVKSLSGGTVINYHNEENLKIFAETYNEGEIISETRNSFFNVGEGWTGLAIAKSASGASVVRTYNIEIENVVTDGPDAKLEVLFSGNNIYRHNVELLLGDPSTPFSVVSAPEFTGHVNQKVAVNIPSAWLIGSTFTVSVRVNGVPGYADRVSVSYVKLKYPQQLSLQTPAKTFYLQSSEGLKTASIASGQHGIRFFNISDTDNITELTASYTGSNYILNLPGSASIVYGVSAAAFKKVTKIVKSELTTFLPDNPQITAADFIVVTHSKFYQAAKAYAGYRHGSAGGGFDTLVATVNLLYDQFCYGEFSPLAIRNFCRFLADIGDPRYLFIIGKGLDVNYNHFRIGKWYRYNPEAYAAMVGTWDYAENFVPPAGTPTSDLVYVMGLRGQSDYVPLFPVGRLNAKYPEEVYAYLEKVKTHESASPNQLWRKNVLHLSGGKTEAEIIELKSRLLKLQPIVEDTVFGGKVVKHIVKSLGSYVDDRLIETVAEQVNQGVSYVTFMGHASPSVPDIDIGFVTNKLYQYNNYGKYPMMIFNGCNTVNGLVPYSLGEDWMQTANKGAILTMGHSHYGYTGLMEWYTRSFYQHAFSYRSTFTNGLSVGDIQKNVIIELQENDNIYIHAMLQQMFLQGDPAVKMYAPEKTDLGIENAYIIAPDGKELTAAADSFAVAVVVRNYGISSKDSLLVSIKRTVGNSTFNYSKYFPSVPNYEDTLFFWIRKGTEDGYGLNAFQVTLDPYQVIPETDRGNNLYSFQHFIPVSTIKPVSPSEFSIVYEQPVTLLAQATNLLLTDKVFYLELDTSYLFNSAFKKTRIINGGPIIKWENLSLLPDVQVNDSIVYYWRVRFNDILPGEDTVWGESSFIYIKGSPEGWSQSEIPQLQKNKFDNITINHQPPNFTFNEVQAKISVTSPGNKYVGPEVSRSSRYWAMLGLNGDGILFEERGGCGQGILAMSLDKSTLVPYFPLPNMYMCGWEYSGKRINTFYNIQHVGGYLGSQADLITYIDSVKSGDYVLIFSYGNASFDKWGQALKDKLKSKLGAKLIDSAGAEMAYILLARKDSLNPVAELYGNADEIISLEKGLKGRFNSGSVETPAIGPVTEWGKIYKKINLSQNDGYNLRLIGLKHSGEADTLATAIIQDSLDISYIDPNQYPYLKLAVEMYDSTFLTPPAIDKLQVILKEAPEGTMNPVAAGAAQYEYFVKQEGDSVKYSYVFTNISDKDFPDSISVKFTLSNYSSGRKKQEFKKVKPLKAGESVSFSYHLHTVGWAGDNHLQVYVNPQIQAEKYYNNNILETTFLIESDKLNPLLTVTFDGYQIMDGEIVSPSPFIVISLRDENKYLLKTDTTDFGLFLRRPCSGCEFEKINFNSPEIKSWGQANARANNFRIEFQPEKLTDGIHTLRVQGKDASGNPAGSEPYQINFEVINESSITNFYPYPNPFSTSTRFVFTLTGNKIPEDIKIQIMTVTGKVVREIRKAELGPLRIGNNITEYAWDGKDEFGDQLANGVYLYKVTLKGAEDFKHRATASDKAFKKNFGKLYLLR